MIPPVTNNMRIRLPSTEPRIMAKVGDSAAGEGVAVFDITDLTTFGTKVLINDLDFGSIRNVLERARELRKPKE